MSTTARTTTTSTTDEQGSTTMTDKKQRDGLFTDPGAIAPSVDKAWRDDFIIELRLLDVPGPRIGDALMTVETHVAESGESAQEAFGDARAYARELEPQAERGRWPVTPVFIIGNLLGLVGLMLTARAFTGWLEGGEVEATIGDAASVAVAVTLLGVITASFGRLIRFIMNHPWWVFAISFAGLGLLVALPVFLLPEPLVDVPALPLGLAGVALLAVSSVIAYRETQADQDEILAPGQRPTGANAGLLTAGMLPAATVLVLLIVWIPSLFV